MGRMVVGVSEAEARRPAAGGIGGGKGRGGERKDRRWGRIEFVGPQTPQLLRGGAGHGVCFPSPGASSFLLKSKSPTCKFNAFFFFFFSLVLYSSL